MAQKNDKTFINSAKQLSFRHSRI